VKANSTKTTPKSPENPGENQSNAGDFRPISPDFSPVMSPPFSADEERARQLTFVINGATLADHKYRFTFRQDGALMKDTLTVNEAAETLGIPAWKVYRSLEAGQLHGKRTGKAYQIPATEIQRLREAAQRAVGQFALTVTIAEAARSQWAQRIAAAQATLDTACRTASERYTLLLGEQKSGGIARHTIDQYTEALTQLEDALGELKVLDRMAVILADLDGEAVAQARQVHNASGD